MPLLYEDLTYMIRRACFNVWKEFGPAYKETVYQKALALELETLGLPFAREKQISISYKGRKVGTYQPDFIVADKILVEIKVVPKLLKLHEKQAWYYLKGSSYKLAILLNFGGEKLEIKRIIFDKARKPSA